MRNQQVTGSNPVAGSLVSFERVTACEWRWLFGLLGLRFAWTFSELYPLFAPWCVCPVDHRDHSFDSFPTLL